MIKFQIFKFTSIFIIVSAIFLSLSQSTYARLHFFNVQSIDTMKFSRDNARTKINDSSYDEEIDKQIRNIAATGATHVGLGTPYDEEFLPYLKRWITSARKYKLSVWFRGNFSGWEGWFDYPSITKEQHTAMTKQFILNHPDLFADGDVFTSCPECENGVLGDPRMKGDVGVYKAFILGEYRTVKSAFRSINKNVLANFYSMNGDVARLLMDEEMTKSLDGAVTIDHYVSTPDKLVNDAKDIAEKSKGEIVLGEFGAPIPDIHGDMTEAQQANWINEAFKKLVLTPQVVAINYWTNMASSTQLWNNDYSPRQAVGVVTKYFDPINISGSIKDENEQLVREVTVKGKERTLVVSDGTYTLPVLDGESVTFSKYGYVSVNIKVNKNNTNDIQRDIVLQKSYPTQIYTLFMKIVDFFKRLLK